MASNLAATGGGVRHGTDAGLVDALSFLWSYAIAVLWARGISHPVPSQPTDLPLLLRPPEKAVAPARFRQGEEGRRLVGLSSHLVNCPMKLSSEFADIFTFGRGGRLDLAAKFAVSR